MAILCDGSKKKLFIRNTTFYVQHNEHFSMLFIFYTLSIIYTKKYLGRIEVDFVLIR